MEQFIKESGTKIVPRQQVSFSNKKDSPSFFSAPFIQPKLNIGPVDDPYEREADAMADKVMRMSDAETIQSKASPLAIQRKCDHCKEEENIQRRSATGTGVGTAPTIVQDTISRKGQPLDTGTKKFMESRFGYDFSNVQVHNDSLAHQSSAEINALAYTHGQNVVFGKGQYQPGTNAGKKLLAHELTHVVQQQTDVVAPKIQRHRDDIVAYSSGQSGFLMVIQAGNLIYFAPAVSGHPGAGENEPGAGPIPTGNYKLHPNIVHPTVTSMQSGVCGASGISKGYQEITSNALGECSGNHYCNIPCPTTANPAQNCFSPVDCWGPKRIKIEGHANVITPTGKRATRDGFYIHGGNPADAVSSGCVKSLDNAVFDNIRLLSGVNGAVPFCVGGACPPLVMNSVSNYIGGIFNF